MSFKYITVFDPTRSKTEEDTHKKLLLYHSFETSEVGLNEKLGVIGILEGLWRMTVSLAGDDEVEKTIRLGSDEVILMIKLESQYFMALSICNASVFENKTIPSQYYLSHLWYSYQSFCIHNGNFNSLTGQNELTNALNEYIVIFWQDIALKPSSILRKGLQILHPEKCKLAEFSKVAAVNNQQSWESLLNQDILLDPESYLGVRNLLVYHLPTNKTVNNVKTQYGSQSSGLVKNFNKNFSSISELSNWIMHLYTTYDVLSTHILSGNAHYKESDLGGISSDQSQAGNNNQAQDQLQEGSMYSMPKAILHNMTLPISFAYDTVQEIGATTGISQSMSLFMDYLPRFQVFNNDSEAAADAKNPPARNGFLISPLADNLLPLTYKYLRLKFEFAEEEERKDFKCLFWYHDDVLVVVVLEDTFDKIWDQDYLKDLHFKLAKGIDCLYDTVISVNDPKTARTDDFAYFITKKNNGSKNYIYSSIPSWFSEEAFKLKQNSFQLIIDGFDQALRYSVTDRFPFGSSGIDYMGTLFGISSVANGSDDKAKSKESTNFLHGMSEEKLFDLHTELLKNFAHIKPDMNRDDIEEERLLKLSNGLQCYICQNKEGTTVIIRNWFSSNDKIKYSDNDKNSLIYELGSSVANWKEHRTENGLIT